MASTSVSRKEYLKRYENNKEEEKKKKKKKNKKTTKDAIGVLVVDEDPVWQKPVKLEDDEDDDSEEEQKPQVNEDIEVKRMKRLDQIRAMRPYNAISEDGSGWVSISNSPMNSHSSKISPDASPSRGRRTRNDTPSPEPEAGRTATDDKDPDISPPRRQRRRFHTPSPEPELASSSSMRVDLDLSPRRRTHSQRNLERPESPDLSPPRRARSGSPKIDASRALKDSDLSPPRKTKRSEPPDHSPSRRIRHRSPEGDATGGSLVSDLSPPRKSNKGSSTQKQGTRAGLFSADEIKKELDKRRAEEISRFKEMDPSVSGRGAEAVYRREGKRISKDELLKLQKGEEKPKEMKLEWGKGLVQKRAAEAKEQELEVEKDKPFARTRDDPELDGMLKERIRWGDPMAHLVKRKQPELALDNLGDDEKMKESGFLIPQDIPSHSWIKRRIDAAPNRYGIRPGRHWDGVDRSTGYEKEYFKRMNEKQATEKEAYLWSVSDM